MFIQYVRLLLPILKHCPFNPPQIYTFRRTHPCYSRHITFRFLHNINCTYLFYVFAVHINICCVLYVFTETQAVLYCVPPLNSLHIGNNYFIYVTYLAFFYSPSYFPSLASSYTSSPCVYLYVCMYLPLPPMCTSHPVL